MVPHEVPTEQFSLPHPVAVRGAGLLVFASTLVGCSEGVLNPHGPVGNAERLLLYDATAIMLAVVIPVMLLALGVAWWFRAGNARARYRPEWEYSGRIEVIVWSVPGLLIIFLGGVAWIAAHDLDPREPLQSALVPLEVEVVSLDWRWLFIYPSEGIASVDQLTVPAGVPIHFRLSAFTVMNSFFVPELGSQIYTMPGMTTQLNLQADTPGVYPGLSAQFSGEGFSDMRFELHAVSHDEFAAWVMKTRERGDELNAASFLKLARPQTSTEVFTYAPVEPRLFEAIASGHMTATSSHREH